MACGLHPELTVHEHDGHVSRTTSYVLGHVTIEAETASG